MVYCQVSTVRFNLATSYFRVISALQSCQTVPAIRSGDGETD